MALVQEQQKKATCVFPLSTLTVLREQYMFITSMVRQNFALPAPLGPITAFVSSSECKWGSVFCTMQHGMCECTFMHGPS